MDQDTRTDHAWRDTALPVDARVEALLRELTLQEKVAQLYGIWVGASTEGGEVAPHQHDMAVTIDLDELLPRGLGQLTRPFGTAPVDPALGARSLQRTQERIVSASRLGIPAIAHEECLAGFAAYGATAYPVPLSWAATFDSALVERMARAIGDDLRSVGVHQGLAPVFDVVRDARWGRVEETMGEDPYLIGTIGAAYVRGLESAGIIATLKHFVGYSASRAGRNLAPVSIGRRELADVLLPPFEHGLRDGGARSVMNSYSDLDGVPTAADRSILTTLLREQWGFDGTVVSDYFAIGFLAHLHGVAAGWVDAAAIALEAGIDVELPTVRAFGDAFVAAVAAGEVDESLVDRALRRVLRQKVDLGLLDPDWSAVPPALARVADGATDAIRGTIDLDPPANRAIARDLAERAIVLVRNDGTLPFAAPARIAVLGPNADDPYAMLGGYSFPSHVGRNHPDQPMGIAIPTVLEALRAEFPDAAIDHAPGTTVDGGETDGIPAALELARAADVVVLALGDRAGLFGGGTTGEGSDAESLSLPGAQQTLLDAVVATGVPTAVVLLTGRPYALGSAPAGAVLEAFFPGEEGGPAIAGVLSGRINPSGRLPVSVPAHPGAQPSTYLASPLASKTSVSTIDPTPAYPFGHGLGYTTFEWTHLDADAQVVPIDGEAHVALRVRNTGERTGTEVVQLYLHDPVASVVRPVRLLVGFARLELEAGASAVVTFTVPADLASFTGVDGARIVEPGELELELGRSSGDIVATQRVALVGQTRAVGFERALHPVVQVVAD